MFEPYHPLYNNIQCLAGTRIVDLNPGQPFHILIANFDEDAIDLLPHQVVTYESQLQETIFESNITHAEILSLIPDNVDSKLCKPHVDTGSIATINNHLPEQ